MESAALHPGRGPGNEDDTHSHFHPDKDAGARCQERDAFPSNPDNLGLPWTRAVAQAREVPVLGMRLSLRGDTGRSPGASVGEHVRDPRLE